MTTASSNPTAYDYWQQTCDTLAAASRDPAVPSLERYQREVRDAFRAWCAAAPGAQPAQRM